MKIIKKLLIFIILLSGFFFSYSMYHRIISWNWNVTTAEIEFIGIPGNVVIGTYTDKNGVTYHEKTLYIGNIESKKIGDKVKVLYGSGLTEHLNYTRMMSGLIISGVVLGASICAYVALLKKGRRSKQKA